MVAVGIACVGVRLWRRGGVRRSRGSSSSGRSGGGLLLVVGVLGWECVSNGGISAFCMLRRTQLVAYPGASGDTADTSRGQHGGRVALVFLLFLELDGVRGGAGSGVVVVAAVAVGVAEEAALVVGGGGVVVGVGGRGSVRAGRQVGGGVPLGAACGLLDVAMVCKYVDAAVWGRDLQPALAVLVPLLSPAWWHWWRSTIRRGRSLGCWRSRVVLLRGVALTVALLRLAVALRRTSMLLRWLTILLLRRLAVLLLRLAALVVVTIRYTTVSRSSATRCSVRVTVGRLRRRLGRLF